MCNGSVAMQATRTLLTGPARLLHLPEAANHFDAADNAGLQRAPARLIQQVHFVNAHKRRSAAGTARVNAVMRRNNHTV